MFTLLNLVVVSAVSAVVGAVIGALYILFVYEATDND